MAVQDECESKDTSTNDDSADCCDSSSLFDMTVVRDRFHEAYSSGDAAGVRLRHYIDGYTELQKFMDLLGPLFSFVSKDVSDKLGLLERLHSGPNRVHYETVESMISYEVQNDVRKWKRESGTRTLLRLHRPLLFINNFMQGVPRQEEHQGLSSLACEVYRSTLAQHHPFLIRQAVSVAMWTVRICAFYGFWGKLSERIRIWKVRAG